MEKQLLKKSGILAIAITFILLTFWFGFSKISLGIDTSNWTPYYIKKNSVVSEQLIIIAGTSGSGIVFGTTSGQWVGTPTDSTLARIFFNTATGRLEFKPSGTTASYPFGSVTVAYLDANYATIAALSSYLLSTGGVGTSNVLNTPTLNSAQLAGSTTIGTGSTIITGTTAFSGTKVGFLADVDENIEAHFGTVESSVSTHAHAGTDSVQIDHANVLNKGTVLHTDLDTLYNSKAQANGLASLNSNSLVVQNPASTSQTPGTGTIPITGTNTNTINDAFLSNNVTKLGTPTTSNIPEGSNLYHTDARVNTLIGNSSIDALLDVQIVSPADGHKLTYDIATGKWIAGTSSASVAWSGVTGTPTENPFVSSTPGVGIPYSTNGNLNNWITSLPILVLSGTSTITPSVGNILFVQVGTSSVQIGTGTTIVVGTLSGGIVTDSGNNGNPGSNCFDGNTATSYEKQYDQSWIKYNMGTGSNAAINTIAIHGSPSVDPEGFQYLGSNDDSGWILLYSGTHTAGTTWQTFTFTNDTAYQFHKMDIIYTSHGSDWREMAEIGFLRRTYPIIMDACTTYTLKFLDDEKNLRFSVYSPGTRTTETSRVSFPTGNVGIGAATPTAQLHTTGTVRFGNLGAGTVQSDANGNLSVSSDERLKNIQGKFTAGITELLGINPILYKHNKESGLETENTYAGFSAQNVMQYIPEAIGIDGRGYRSLSDRPIIAALVNSIKELQKEIDELETKARMGEFKMKYIITGVSFFVVMFGMFWMYRFAKRLLNGQYNGK